jgi:hypothetical protein
VLEQPCVLSCYRRAHIPAGRTLPLTGRNHDERMNVPVVFVFLILQCSNKMELGSQ